MLQNVGCALLLIVASRWTCAIAAGNARVALLPELTIDRAVTAREAARGIAGGVFSGVSIVTLLAASNFAIATHGLLIIAEPATREGCAE